MKLNLSTALPRRLRRSQLPFGLSLMAALVLTWSCATAGAQNPFGDPADPDNPFGMTAGQDDSDPLAGFGQPAGDNAFSGFGVAPRQPNAAAVDPAIAAAPRADETDPIVIAIRQTPPETPEQFANALTWLTRIKRFDEVGRLLTAIQAKNWPPGEVAELSRTGGTALWVRLGSLAANLSAEQRQQVSDILRSPGQLARQPSWIDGWIAKLASNDPGAVRLAQVRLQDAGTAAVVRLVEHILAEDTRVPPAILAATALEFGHDGRDALRAACMVQDSNRLLRVLMAAAELPSSKSGNPLTAELGAAATGQMLPVELKGLLVARLSERYATLPSSEAVAEYLTRQFDKSLSDYQSHREPATDLADIIWRPTTDGNSVQTDTAPSRKKYLERAAQLAALRLHQPVQPAGGCVDCVAVLLQREYQINPSLDVADDDGSSLVSLASIEQSLDSVYQRAFLRASELQMHGAALRAIQRIGHTTGESEFNAPLAFLSERLRDPRPVIRFAALEAIAQVDPQSRYAGAETALDVAVEMSQLSEGPQALVIGLHSERRQAAQQQLALQTGADVITASSARSAYLALQQEKPIEIVLIVDRVSDQSIFELIQRLRGGLRSHALPIAVLADELFEYERDLIARTPGVVQSVLSKNPEQMERVIAMLMDELDTQPLSEDDRAFYHRTAVAFLAKLGNDRETYAFYPLSDVKHKLDSTLSAMAPAARVQLLSGVASVDSQRELVQMAANSVFDESVRVAAARGFSASVRRFGLTLSDADRQATYDLYNQVGPVDPVAVKSLGMVLDVMEAQQGLSSWPMALKD